MTAILSQQLMTGVPVAFASHPMGGNVWRDVQPAGRSLAEIVRSVPDLPHWFEDFGTVCVGGVPVPRRYWSRRPSEQTRTLIPKVSPHEPSWVTLHVAPRGGGGGRGGKSIISTVAAVALIAVGAFITGGGIAGLGGLAPGLFAAGSTSAYIAAAGVTTLGRLALTLLAPPPAQDRRQNPQAPVLGSAGASGNTLQPGGPIARVCADGLKIFPSFACNPLIELNGDDETVEACYLLAGPHKIRDIRIENGLIDEISGLQSYVSEGLSETPASILNRYGNQRTVNVELEGHRRELQNPDTLRNQANPESDLPKWRPEASAFDPDEIWFQLSWPGGMGDPADISKSFVMPFRVRMRVQGTEAWLNLPELHFRHKRTSPLTKKVVIKWGAPPSPILDQAEGFGAWHSYHTVPAQNGVAAPVQPGGLGGWTAHASFVGTAGVCNATARVVRAYDGFTIYLDETAFPRGNRWEVQIIRGCLFNDNDFTPATYIGVGAVGILSYFDYVNGSGTAKVPTGGLYNETLVERVVLSRFASVKNQMPVPVAGHAVIEVRARALNVTQLSCIAGAYVPDWNGAEWTGSVTTSNPAPHFRDMLAGRYTDDPVLPAAIANPEILAFRQHCIDNGHEIAAAIDGQPWFDAMQAVASVGYGRVRGGARWGIAFDRDTSLEAPTQSFSPRNANNFTLEKPFERLPEAFRISFRNRARDWAEDERLVIRPGLTRADVKVIDVIDAVGLDTEASIVARFERDLLAAYLQDHAVSFDVPPDGLVSQMGDLIGLTHVTLSRHHAAARVAGIITDGAGLCTGLRLDNAIEGTDQTSFDLVADFASLADVAAQGVTLGCVIVTGDAEITKELVTVAGETDRIAFADPFDPDGIARGHLVLIGEATKVRARYLVKDVVPTRRMNLRIIATPETPELWS